MVFVVENATDAPGQASAAIYEQPLNERMRTFLRLEFLQQQTEHHSAESSDIATRQAVNGLLEIGAILTRGDVRSEVLKELERQIEQLQAFAANPSVDHSRVDSLVDQLLQSRDAINAIGPHYLQTLKDSEFLSAIKHRSAIPGGTCEFDLPLYSHWLRRPYQERRADLDGWLADVRALCDGVRQIMWLIRQSAIPTDYVAEAGMYQHSISKEVSCRMLRVKVNDGQGLFPEISGSPQRFTIRFLAWQDINSRPAQTDKNVAFQLSIC